VSFISGRRALRYAIILLTAAVPVAYGLAVYLQSSAEAYPISDGAVLEIYTLHAVKGFWPFGPYSQFRWHHPGPMLFYLLAPFYALGGYRTIALHAGALAINLASVLTIAGVLIRSATPAVACTGVAALGLFLFRVDALAGSYWNPHIVVLPVAALLVLCARLASGRLATLPAIVVAGSFLAQTHVSLVPYVGVLVGVALAVGIVWREQPVARWIGVSAVLLLLLWLPPLVEQVRHWPGNVSQLATFFSEPFDGPPWATVFGVWGDVMSAALRPGLKMPVGWAAVSDVGNWLPALGAVQAALLGAGCLLAARQRNKFSAALCGLGLLATLTAFWSITRIRTLIGDYMVFWMSIVGVMNWAAIVGLAIDALIRRRVAAGRAVAIRWVAVAAAAVVAVMFVSAGARQIAGAKDLANRNQPASARDVRIICDALDAYLAGEQVKRPLFQSSAAAWGDAAGVILYRYRSGQPITVSPDLVWMFGDPLAPTGHEDGTIIIADRAAHAELVQQPGDHFIARRGGIYLHARQDGNR
jgi:hypothetical protein